MWAQKNLPLNLKNNKTRFDKGNRYLYCWVAIPNKYILHKKIEETCNLLMYIIIKIIFYVFIICIICIYHIHNITASQQCISISEYKFICDKTDYQ